MWIKWIMVYAISIPVWAFNLTTDFNAGFYWERLPIPLTVIETIPARKTLLEKITQYAIKEWETDSRLNMWEFVRSEASPATTNVIRWSENFGAETRMDEASVLAVAIRYTDGPYFARTEVIINGKHPLNMDETHLRTTLIHELGHTMGLDHSEDSLAVMAPSLQTYYMGLQQDDLDGILSAHEETERRQVTKFVSPLSYEAQKTSGPVGCGTVTTQASGTSANALLSLAGGILISFIRRIKMWFKSLF